MNWGSASRLQTFWDVRAACNFIGGGTGSGLLVWAAIGLNFGLPYFPAALIGLVFVGAGLLMVWLEIGKPWRAFHVFFRPQTSWMAREGILALPLFATGTIAVLVAAKVGIRIPIQILILPDSPVVPAVLTAFFALAFLYCQLRILNSAQGIPAWREPKAMLLLGISGLTEGLGIYIFVGALAATVSAFMLATALLLLIARAFAWNAYIAALRHSEVPEPAMAALLSFSNCFLIVGHLLPGILVALSFVWPGVAIQLAGLAGVAAALGGWLLKVTLITRAAFIPRDTVPFTPVRGRPGSTGDVPGA
jgi:phenylacetyl-CoA:acceptor oxidoreductase 26-kDa subunit